MKKHNFFFVGECAVILVLLLVIGILIKDDKHLAQEKESINAVVEVQNSVVDKERGFVDEYFSESKSVNELENTDVEMPTEETIVEEVALAEEEVLTAYNLSEDEEAALESDKTQIVVFGDSIWNANRGENGISEQIMEALNDVVIYNCAIGGTTAAVDGEPTDFREWTSRSFNGMMYIATDIIDENDLIPNDEACNVIKDIDFEKIDYVIISYGLNDYFSDIPVHPREYYDLHSYVGALRHGIQKLKEKYPHMEFVVTSPTYCEWFKGERQFELGAYTEAARSVAREMDVHFLDMYHALGKTPDEKTEYLSDGVHLNDEGMTLYANWVIEYLKELEKEES